MKAVPTLARPGRRGGSLVAAAIVALGAACGTWYPPPTDTGRVTAVAAEDVWGSILTQVGGERVAVTSIVTNPAVDPHDYDARPADAVALAEARLVVVNGVGYDPWASKLLDANPVAGRQVLDVGRLVGARPGDDPHQWYVPADVHRVVDAMGAELGRISPADSARFEEQGRRFATDGLRRYDELLDEIRSRYRGTPIAVTESIFLGMAEALGLRVLTPEAFARAVAEGDEPTAQDKQTVDRQITTRQVAVLVYNSQNATPDVVALVAKAKGEGIPVTTVTETIVPRGTTFQDWQVRQLEALRAALGAATGR